MKSKTILSYQSRRTGLTPWYTEYKFHLEMLAWHEQHGLFIEFWNMQVIPEPTDEINYGIICSYMFFIYSFTVLFSGRDIKS